MVKMLSEKYNMICCGENFHCEVSDIVAMPDIQPDLCYMKTMADWKEYVENNLRPGNRPATDGGDNT